MRGRALRGEPAELSWEPGRSGDMPAVLGLLTALPGVGDSWTMAFQHPGEPISKHRHRMTRTGHRYTPRASLEAQEELAWRWRASVRVSTPLDGNLALAAIFYRPNRRSQDVDNMMKLVMDAATQAGIWHDDSQVTAQVALVELDAEKPRTLVALGLHSSTLTRRYFVELTCAHCGTPARVRYYADREQRFCSPRCAAKGRNHRGQMRLGEGGDSDE